VPEPLVAPLSSSAPIGKLRVMLSGPPLGTYPLHVTHDLPEAGFFGKLLDEVRLWME
jgi:serine-type D-Ala-D-Ala carboxypeptidase (penicillin-binding protein 5/6)